MGIYIYLVAYEGIFPWNDERYRILNKIWDINTMGGKYHIPLLAIACLIADRLGRKVCVYGDITAG